MAAGSPGLAAALLSPLTAWLRAWITASSVPFSCCHVALDRLDQVRNQVVAPLELHLDLRERVLEAVLERHELVVDADRP